MLWELDHSGARPSARGIAKIGRHTEELQLAEEMQLPEEL
jgi:hypothetical protein